MASAQSLRPLVDGLSWDRRRHPHSGRAEYSRTARQVAVRATQILDGGTTEDRRALVRILRTAVDRVTRALQHLDDSSGGIGEDLRVLMALYARACRNSPPSPAPLAAWLVELVWNGPGWPEVKLADFAPALGPQGLAQGSDWARRGLTHHPTNPDSDRLRDLLVELVALRGATRPADVVEPYRELIEQHILNSGCWC